MTEGHQMTPHNVPSGLVENYDLDTLGAPFKVTLKNCVSMSTDPETGQEIVHVPDMVGLVLAVVRCRVRDRRKLAGEEIKFIRHALGVQANKLARFLDVTPEHYSRCEATDRVLSVTAEKQLRLFAYGATLFDNPEKLLDMFEKAEPAPEPLSKKAEKMARTFFNVFMAMKIEPVRDAQETIEYVFTRCKAGELGPDDIECDDDDVDAGDWTRLPPRAAA